MTDDPRPAGLTITTRPAWAAAILLVAMFMSPGCADRGKTASPGTAGNAARSGGWSDPVAALRQLAGSENADPQYDLPIPDQAIADRLAPRTSANSSAWADLDAAVKTLSVTYDVPPAKSPRPPSDRVFAEVGRLYRAAREQYLDGQYFESIRQLEQALKLDPGAVAAMRLLAQNHMATTGAVRALQYYRQIITIDPDDVDALWHVGSAAWQRRRIDEAAYNLGHAFQIIDPDSTDAQQRELWLLTAHDLAQVLFDQGYDSAGVEVWSTFWKRLDRDGWSSILYQSELDRIHRRRAELEMQHGDALARLGQFHKAARRYESAADIARRMGPDVITRLVWANCKTGRVASAMLIVLDALEHDDTSQSAVDLVGGFAGAPHDELLRQAVRNRLEQNSDDLRYVEAAAKLMPPERRDEVMLGFLEAHGSDPKYVRQLLPWMIDHLGTGPALRAVVDLAQSTGQDMQDLTAELISITDDPETLINTIDNWPAKIRTAPPARRVRIDLLLQSHRLPEALDAARTLYDEDTSDWPARLLYAQSLTELNLDTRALALLVNAAPRPSDRIQWHYDRALLLARLGREQAALGVLDSLERAFDLSTAQQVTHLQRKARLYNTANQPHLAADALLKAVALDPANEDSYAPLMRLYGLGGPLQDADSFGRITRQLFAVAPDSDTLTLLRAEQNAVRGQYDDAIAACKSLLNADRSDAGALRILVTAWVQAGRASEAVQWLDSQLAQRPGDPQWRDAWIQALMADGQSTRAADYLQKVVQRYPYDLDAHRQLEKILESTGRKDEARQLTRARWERMPESVARQMAFSELSVGDDDASAALEHLHKAVDLAGADLPGQLEDIVMQAARIAQADKDHAQDANNFTVQLIHKALESGAPLDRTSQLAYVNALVALEAPLDQLTSAIDRAGEASLDDSPDPVTLAAVTLTQKGREQDAMAIADHWLDAHAGLLDADSAMLVHWRLVQTISLDEPDRAIALVTSVHDAAVPDLYQKIAILSPQDRDLNAASPLAESLYMMSAQFSAADYEPSHEKILVAALQADPDHPGANNDLGYSLADRGERLDEAQDMLVKAVNADPQKSEYLDSLGWVRYKLGQLKDNGQLLHEQGAVSLLEQAAEFRPAQSVTGRESPVVLDHLGDAYWRAGRSDDALAAWNRAIGAYNAIIGDAQNNAGTIDLIRQYYGPVFDAAQAKIDAVNGKTTPPVAPSPALDNNSPAPDQ